MIVTCNSGKEIGPCLDAGLRTGAEIVVVDNASEDQTQEEVNRRGVRLISNMRNRGFAAAVNQGIQALDTTFLLLLNPDAIIAGSIEPLREACDSPEVAGAGGRLIDYQGKTQAGFLVRRFPSVLALTFEALLLNRLWPGNPVNWHYRCLDLDYASFLEVEQPAGAFLMIRRDIWNKLGGFDERFYPLWFEDVDYCKRARDLGYRLCYVPSAAAKHSGGHSIQKIPLEFRQLYWYGSLLKYTAKHFQVWSHRTVCLAVMIGSLLRMTAGIFIQRSLTPIAVYGRVVKLSGHYMTYGGQRRVEILSVP